MVKPLSRRAALQALGASLLAPAVGCASDESGGAVPSDASMGSDAGRDAGMDLARDMPPPATWASGGTAAMVDAASYPDPFAAGAGCALFAESTPGPCYTSSPLRQDVSEGFPGLPLRLALQLLDAECTPLEGARLEIWHTRNSGLYSEGPIDFCTLGDADAAAATYYRGVQVSDAEGKLAFDTCFPGWYPGRAIHIHFQVTLAGGAIATRVSQLFFEAELIQEIFAEHPDYVAFGQPDTPNARDGIFLGIGDASVLSTARMTDGAMLASKAIQIV
ncbi:MAG: protocatechuate 3,4-dioxygenase [Myxococcota bacterium]